MIRTRNKISLISIEPLFILWMLIWVVAAFDLNTTETFEEVDEPDQNQTASLPNEDLQQEEYVTGILLENNQSAACNAIYLEDIDEYQLCFYLQLRAETSNMEQLSTIIELHGLNNNKNNFELLYDGLRGSFVINYNGKQIDYKETPATDRWIHLCVYKKPYHGNYWIEVEPSPENYQLDNKTFDLNPDYKNGLLCVGANNESKSSFTGSVAAIILRKLIMLVHIDTFIVVTELFESYKFSGTIMRSPEQIIGDIKKRKYNLEDLFWSTNEVLLLKESFDYFEHKSRCENSNGRLITAWEATSFRKLRDIYLNKSAFDLKQVNGIGTWVNVGENNSSSLCSSFDFKTMKLSYVSCNAEFEINFCVLPKNLTTFYLYGDARKYDRLYYLQINTSSWYFKGSDGSVLSKKHGYWTLHSIHHDKQLVLQNKTYPLGRNVWKSLDGMDERLLTFTNCKEYQFSCSNNKCASKYWRCDGFVNCPDGSDEKNCVKFRMQLEEKTIENSPPYPGTSIEYNVTLYSIGKISPGEGTAEVDLGILLAWNDKRVTYILHNEKEYLNCDEIWVPPVYTSDILQNHLEHKVGSSKCYSENNVSKTITETDPYMGSETTGNNVKIFYYLQLKISIPCHCGFHKYPFGAENFTMILSLYSLHSTVASGIHKFDNYELNYMKNFTDDKIDYYGKKNLEEFRFIEATHSLSGSKDFITINIRFQTLYGYHVVNSFTPSFLICIIAYCTLFFPKAYFNERIMVSLTSLLVLAALMTQSSNQSSRTSNINYLDIWHLSLISFCFLLVLVNLLIHRLKRNVHDNNTIQPLSSIQPENKFYWYWTIKINIFFKFAMALLLASFVALFILSAANIIFVDDAMKLE